MNRKSVKNWNQDVTRNIRQLKPVMTWLGNQIGGKRTDWTSQKSAHQALRLLDMAEYEMWNMQYFENTRERRLYNEEEDTVA